VCVAPHPDTVTRLLCALGAQGLADAVGAWLASRAQLGPVTTPVDGTVTTPAEDAVDGTAEDMAEDAAGGMAGGAAGDMAEDAAEDMAEDAAEGTEDTAEDTVLRPGVAFDGKAMRNAIGPDGQIPYLLAAATHGESVVIAERLVGAKSNEVPSVDPLLR